MSTRLTTIAAIALTLAACTGASTPTTEQNPTTTSTTATATSTTPVFTSTTVSASTTTRPNVTNDAEGSGCTPGQGALPDGEWFGIVATTDDSELEFDLACWFTGDAAVRAAAEDGEESPPPNDYYVRNANETLRSVPVADVAEVIWYPEVGDPTSETTVSYSDWISQRVRREFDLGVWLEVENGTIVKIREQWVP